MAYNATTVEHNSAGVERGGLSNPVLVGSLNGATGLFSGGAGHRGDLETVVEPELAAFLAYDQAHLHAVRR